MIKNMMDKIQVYTDGALPILSKICNKIGLQENIDEQVESSKKDNCIVSTGQAVVLQKKYHDIIERKRESFKGVKWKILILNGSIINPKL